MITATAVMSDRPPRPRRCHHSRMVVASTDPQEGGLLGRGGVRPAPGPAGEACSRSCWSSPAPPDPASLCSAASALASHVPH
jgi:hypothetical protein